MPEQGKEKDFMFQPNKSLIFFFYSTQHSMVWYMSTSPGKLTGKFSYHVSITPLFNRSIKECIFVEESLIILILDRYFEAPSKRSNWSVSRCFYNVLRSTYPSWIWCYSKLHHVYWGDVLLQKISYILSIGDEGISQSQESTLDGYLCGILKGIF